MSLGLVDPKQDAIGTDAVQADGGVVEEVGQVAVAVAQSLLGAGVRGTGRPGCRHWPERGRGRRPVRRAAGCSIRRRRAPRCRQRGRPLLRAVQPGARRWRRPRGIRGSIEGAAPVRSANAPGRPSPGDRACDERSATKAAAPRGVDVQAAKQPRGQSGCQNRPACPSRTSHRLQEPVHSLIGGGGSRQHPGDFKQQTLAAFLAAAAW